MNIKNLIEEFYVNDDIDCEQKIEWYNSSDLISLNRFDIAFKIFYLRYKQKCPELSKELYRSHICAITNGSFKEFGNLSKDSFKSFINDFDLIFNSIKEKQFDTSISLIPVTKEGNVLLNGAHRVASAIHLGIKVPTIKIDEKDPIYNLNFFKTRGLSKFHIELAITEYLQHKTNIFIACIWPVAQKSKNQIIQSIGKEKILYSKTINFSPNGAQNLISVLYEGHSWLGDIEDGYKGAISKYAETFTSNGKVTFIFFEYNNLNNVLELKSEIRSELKLGKHSIHINDNYNELIDLSKYILNDNSIHFLNNFNPLSIRNKYSLLKKYRKKILSMGFNLDDFVVVGSYSLNMFGITESNDLDYLSNNSVIIDEDEIESHNKIVDYYQKSINELIYNPQNFFYYKGLKFLSLDRVMKFKENRGELKDKIIIAKFLRKDKTLINYLNTLLYLIQLLKYKSISLIIKYSKPLGLYNFFKMIYKKFK
jgi:hypothetical protein